MAEPDRRLIDEALARFLDGEPEPNDGTLLAEAMRADEHFAREVSRLLMVDDLLRQSGAPDDRAFLDAFALRVAAEREGGEFVQEFERRVRNGGAPSHRPWLPWTIAAAACLVSVLVTGWAVWRRPGAAPPPSQTRPQPVATAETPRPAPAGDDRHDVAPADALAMVIKLDDVRWEPDDGPHPAAGGVLPAGRFRMRSGRATLSFLSGVVLIVEGPADLDLVSSDRVFCRRGRLRTRVPKGAEGFVVSSPRSAVMDLGTDFEVDVGDDGKSRVLIHEGQTEGAVLNEAGIPQRSLRMTRDKTFEIDPEAGRIAAVERPRTVVGPADMVAPSLALDPSYPDAVLASRPWSYWRFEAMADGVTPNEVAGRPPLRAHGPIRLTDAKPGENHSAVFQAGQTGHYFAMDGPWEPSREPGYAIELWFMPEVISHATLAILYVPTDAPDDRHFKHLFFAETTALTRLTMHPPASVRLLHRWPPGSEGGDNLYSRDRYVPFRWHHLVVQANGDRMELFLDGVPNDPLSVSPGDQTTACRFLLGRLTTDPKHSFFTSRPFAGRMDEVALYNRPLAAEEVRRHHQLGTRRDRPK
jgi:hypothetical protein